MNEQRVPTVSADVLARISAKVAEKRASAPKLAAPASRPRRPYHEAAAVLAAYDPRILVPVGAVTSPVPLTEARVEGDRVNAVSVAPLDALLADSIQLAQASDTQTWTLKPDARVAVLRQLREEQRLEEALAQNRGNEKDPLDRVLRGFLSGAPPPVHSMTRDELSAAREVCGWLRDAGFANIPTREDIVGRFEWKALLEPFEHLAAQHFGGRKAELAVLREYADVLPPNTLIAGVRAVINQAFNFTQKPPLVIYGPGGVGKSTLVSRFILEHAQALESDRFPFVYLDFDRTEVAVDQPLTLLVEAVRQLGVEYPDAREQCESLRRGWLVEVTGRHAGTSQVRQTAPIVTLTPAEMSRLLTRATRDFVSLLSSLGVANRPVLFVLDTFEEVQRRSENYVDAIWKLLEDLRASIPRLRVVIVGRAELPNRSSQLLPLQGLDQEAAVGYLKARGIRDHATAVRLARQLGGSPLSLKLAVEVFTKGELDSADQLDVTAREYFFLRVDDALIQRQLYTRILSYVQDEEVRRLAHPGLVLRQLTPELILEVLKEPCRLDSISTLPQARDLFERIRKEVALVTEVDQNTVKHRSDLRALMVPLVRQSEAARARVIDEKAVAYYSAGATPASRAEEIYHRLWLNEPLSTISTRWMAGVEPLLATALDEFSGARKAFLASRLSLEVDEETRQLAELEDWERLTERKAADLLEDNNPNGALKALRARAERTAASALPMLEARALVSLENDKEALAVLDTAIGLAIDAGVRAHALALATYAARVAVRFHRADVAARYRARLSGFREMTAEAIDRLAIAVPVVAMWGLEPPSDAAGTVAAQRDVVEAFDAAPDTSLREHAELTMWAATTFSDPPRLARVMRLVTVRPLRASDLRQLSGEIARVDVAASHAAGEEPGLLARRFTLAKRATVTETWSDFVVNMPFENVRLVVADILEMHEPHVSSGLIGCIRRLPRFALGFETEHIRPAPSEHDPPRPRTRTLSGPELKILRDALVDAFVSREQFDELLLLRLDRSLDAIASPNQPLPTTVLQVIMAANMEGWTDTLIASALEARPNNATLRSAAQSLGISTLVTNLETNVNSKSSMDTTRWRDQLGMLEGQVCRVEVRGQPVGTGFLVGPDLVLTSDVVVGELLDGHVHSSDVACRFDYKADARQVISPGTLFDLDQNPVVRHNRWIDETHGLGYALLRLDRSPGYEPIGGATLESAAELRRWIEIPTQPRIPRSGEGLIILQHPLGRPLQAAFADNGVAGTSADDTRLFHRVNTEPGSSGSPCFTMDFELVGMHIGGPFRFSNEQTNVAVSIAAINDDGHDDNGGKEKFAAFA